MPLIINKFCFIFFQKYIVSLLVFVAFKEQLFRDSKLTDTYHHIQMDGTVLKKYLSPIIWQVFSLVLLIYHRFEDTQSAKVETCM